MKNIFACPHCRVVLNPSIKILLVAAFGKKKGMILLSPQPGNFKYICDSSVEKGLKVGDKVTFSCPVCSAKLTSSRDNKFTELLLLRPGHEDKRVEFSRAFGTYATFVADGEEVVSYGNDAEDFGTMNFFGS